MRTCSRCVVAGALSAGELSLTDDQPTDDDLRLNVRYFNSADEFVASYVQPSVWLLQPLYRDNDSTTDWARADHWLPFLRVVQLLHINTGQINCIASYRYDVILV